jgi:hypothetical protein
MNVMPAILLAAVVYLAGCPGALGDSPAPDIKGKWTGRTYTIVAGHGGHWPTNPGTFRRPGLFEKDLLIEVTGQEGRRFWGMTTISDNGRKTQEPFVGELTGADNRDVVVADTDGYLNGHINGDIWSLCYSQAAATHGSAVVSCTEVKRTR